MKRQLETALTLALLDADAAPSGIDRPGAWVPARPLGLGRGVAWMPVDETPPRVVMSRREVRRANRDAAKDAGIPDPVAERRAKLPGRILQAASMAVFAVTLVPAPLLSKLPPKLRDVAVKAQKAAAKAAPTLDGLAAAAKDLDPALLVATAGGLDTLADDAGDDDTREERDPVGIGPLVIRAVASALAGGADPALVGAWRAVPGSYAPNGQPVPIPEPLRAVLPHAARAIARHLRSR
jgi:hypothetical protein